MPRSPKKCSVTACDRKYRCSGYCSYHYRRVVAGYPEEPKVWPKECSQEGCDKKPKAKGLCNAHYQSSRWTNQVKRKYGLGAEQYQRLVDKADGVCQICKGASTDGKQLSVDHDHATGEIRGVLCNRCNLGLGYFRDSPELLVLALYYLESDRATCP